MIASLLMSSPVWAQGASTFLVSEGAHHGLYLNTIVDMDPVLDYVEVCWIDGVVLTDSHIGGGSTAGGNCAIGDPGFITTLDSQGSFRWAGARSHCTTYGMRLPELVEINIMSPYINLPVNGPGWASNYTSTLMNGADVLVVAPAIGASRKLMVGRVVEDQASQTGQAAFSNPLLGLFETFCVR